MILVRVEKVIDGLHLLLIKTFNKIRIEGNFFNMIMTIYEKSTVSTILNEERLKIFP